MNDKLPSNPSVPAASAEMALFGVADAGQVDGDAGTLLSREKTRPLGGEAGARQLESPEREGNVINTNTVYTKTCADKNTNRPLVWFDKLSPCSSNCASYRVTTGCSVTLSSTAAAAEERPVGDIMAASPRSCPR